MESVGILRRRIKELIEPLGPEHVAQLRGKSIAEQIRYLRVAQGWSQRKLAELAEVNTETVNRIELGSNSRLDTVRRVITAACIGGRKGFVRGSVEPYAVDVLSMIASGSWAGEQLDDSDAKSAAPTSRHEVSGPYAKELAALWSKLSITRQRDVIEMLRLFLGETAPIEAEESPTKQKDRPGARRS